MKHVRLFEEFINEAKEPKPELLVKLHKELSKAKNVEAVGWAYDTSDGHVVTFENGLESESPRHKGELEEFSFFMNDDKDGILGLYDLNGNDEELKTVKDAVKWCRANK
jgi:hypothetical protein